MVLIHQPSIALPQQPALQKVLVTHLKQLRHRTAPLCGPRSTELNPAATHTQPTNPTALLPTAAAPVTRAAHREQIPALTRPFSIRKAVSKQGAPESVPMPFHTRTSKRQRGQPQGRQRGSSPQPQTSHPASTHLQGTARGCF